MFAKSIRSWMPTALILATACGGGSMSGPDEVADTLEPAVGPVVSAASAPRKAWRIDATVAVTPAAPPAGCAVYFTSVIEGHATHLGTFSGVGSTCITGVIQPDPNPPFLPAGPAPYFTAEFYNPLWTLTGANGDELWLESYDAVAVFSMVDNSLVAEGRMRVVGGTGRFAGATGDAMVGAVNEDGIGPDDFSGSGWISYRAADVSGH